MRLVTLGGLEWLGVALTRPKPLLLLAYLALEGPQPRRELARLFWPESPDPGVNLRVALQHLRQTVPGCVTETAGHLRTEVTTDAGEVLALAARDDLAGVERLYGGKFLPGVLGGLGAELEEWVYTTREHIAGTVRSAYLRAAGRAMDAAVAARLAAQALAVPGAGAPEPEDLPGLYLLLARAGHPAAAEVRRAAAEFGLPLEPLPASPGSTEPSLGRVPDHGLLVGREREVAEVCALLTKPGGLPVTVTGPGGIGKSRLAGGVGRALRDRWGERVVWVDLEAVPGPALIAGRICDALGLASPLNTDALAYAVRALGAQSTILILDNAEHLILPTGGVAAVVQALMEGCPGLHLLVTSREPLSLRAEQLYPLGGLDWSGAGGALTLFAERARRLQPDFAVTPETARALRRICERLDGSPLGIELAATWTRTLSPADLADELEESLAVLEGRPAGTGRHASLRAIFDHSWNQLNAWEQEVLRRLTVFRGGWTRRAAGAVALATPPVLAALVNKSMLRLTSQGRFQMHPLVSEYAAEHLAAQPAEWEAAREVHARFFLVLAEEAGPALYGPEQDRWFVRLAEDQANLREASEWGLTHGEPDIVARMQRALWIFVYCREDHAWGRGQLMRAFAHPAISPAGQGILLWAAGGLSRLAGDVEVAGPMLDRAVNLARAQGLGDIELLSLIHRGLLAYAQGDLDTARRDLEACLALAPRLGNPALEAYTYSHLGEHFSRHGDFRRAEPLLQFAARQSRSLAGSWQTAKASLQLANHLRDSGQLEAACQEYKTCLTLISPLSPALQLPQCLAEQALLLLYQGKRGAARVAAQQSLDLLSRQSLPLPQSTGLARQVLAELTLDGGDLVEAEHHLRHAAETFQQADLRPQQLFLLPTLALLLRDQGCVTLAARVLAAVEPLSLRLGLGVPVPLAERIQALQERLADEVGGPFVVPHAEEPGTLLIEWSRGQPNP